jgi:hypothetical protein
MSKEEHLATRTTGLQGSELASGEFCLLKKSDPDHLQCLTHLMFYCMQITSPWRFGMYCHLLGYWHLLCIYSLPPHSLSSPSESS